MARMNPEICRQCEKRDPFYKQRDFFIDKGVKPATGNAFMHKWRKAKREAERDTHAQV